MDDHNKLKIHYFCLSGKGGSSLYIHNLISHMYNEYRNFAVYLSDNYTFKTTDKDIKIVYVLTGTKEDLKNIFVRKIITTIYRFEGIRNFHRILKKDTSKKIIHVQFPFIFIDFYYLKKLKNNAKLILTIHDVLPHKYMISKNIDLYFTKKTYEAFDYYIVHSKQNKYELSKYFGISKDKISVVEHGIEMPKRVNKEEIINFRKQYRVPKVKKIILFFGSLRENKGLGLLLKALAKIKKEDFLLIIAGKAQSKQLCARYFEIIKEKNLEKNVLFLNRFINDNEIPILFNISDFIVLPYKFFHSQSGVLATAITYQLPVIVSDTGSMGDFVRNHNIGKVFKPDSLKQLIESIKYFIESDLEEYKLNEIRCRDEYSWQRVAKKTLEVYNSIMHL